MGKYYEEVTVKNALEYMALFIKDDEDFTCEDIQDLMKRMQPAADVVEVVRCKDCKMWGRTLTEEERQFCIDTNTDLVCEVWMSDGLMPNDFCSYGERKEGEDGQLQDQD